MRRVLKDTGHPVGKDETDTAYWLGWAGHEKAADHLSETWRGCSEILHHLIDGNPQYLNLQWIDSAFEAFRFHLCGILPIGFEVVAFPTKEEKDGLPKGSNLPGFRAYMVRAILEAFRDGASFFAKCPRCKRPFFKTRADKVYDRLLCANEYTRKKKNT